MHEPFSAALDNDHRLHELAALREAAEADRASLLTRLGRKAIKDEIVGADSGLKPVLERAALVAPSDVPVPILGETGTGKEVISRAIHNRSSRASGPFIDRAAILGDGKSLEVSTALGVIPSHARPFPITTSRSTDTQSIAAEVVSLDEGLRRHITLALQATQGRIEGSKGAAKLLQINPHTLRAKMRKLNLDWSHFRE